MGLRSPEADKSIPSSLCQSPALSDRHCTFKVHTTVSPTIDGERFKDLTHSAERDLPCIRNTQELVLRTVGQFPGLSLKT